MILENQICGDYKTKKTHIFRHFEISFSQIAKLAREKGFFPRDGMVMAVGWHKPFRILDEVPFTTIACLQQAYVIHSV
jgi:hypothetical protein